MSELSGIKLPDYLVILSYFTLVIIVGHHFSKYIKVEDVWPEDLIAKMPEYAGKRLYDVLYANGQVDTDTRPVTMKVQDE